MIKRIIRFFDKFEDKLRKHLSHHPIFYTLIGGISVVLFWRGVWHTADMLQAKGGILEWLFYEPTNLIIVTLIMLATGLFVSYFIDDTLLLSGMKGEKKLTEKTEMEIKAEEEELKKIKASIKEIEKDVEEIKEAVVQKKVKEDE